MLLNLIPLEVLIRIAYLTHSLRLGVVHILITAAVEITSLVAVADIMTHV